MPPLFNHFETTELPEALVAKTTCFAAYSSMNLKVSFF